MLEGTAIVPTVQYAYIQVSLCYFTCKTSFESRVICCWLPNAQYAIRKTGYEHGLRAENNENADQQIS